MHVAFVIKLLRASLAEADLNFAIFFPQPPKSLELHAYTITSGIGNIFKENFINSEHAVYQNICLVGLKYGKNSLLNLLNKKKLNILRRVKKKQEREGVS